MGQTSTAHQHSNASADTDSTDLASKIELLLDKVQNLEAQIQSMNTGNAMSDSKGMGGMGMKGKGKMAKRFVECHAVISGFRFAERRELV